MEEDVWTRDRLRLNYFEQREIQDKGQEIIRSEVSEDTPGN